MKNIFATLLCRHQYEDAFTSKPVKFSTLGYVYLTKHICTRCGKVKYFPAKEKDSFTF